MSKPDKFELLSLNPNEKEKGDGKGDFHGYAVLGGTEVKEATRKELVAAFTKAMEGKIDPARCFIPRHGIRATQGDKAVELVICFECAQFHLYEVPGGPRKFFLVGKAAEPVFDKVLSDAKIPKAK